MYHLITNKIRDYVQNIIPHIINVDAFAICTQTSTIDYLSNNFGIELHGFFHTALINIGTLKSFLLV